MSEAARSILAKYMWIVSLVFGLLGGLMVYACEIQFSYEETVFVLVQMIVVGIPFGYFLFPKGNAKKFALNFGLFNLACLFVLFLTGCLTLNSPI